MSPVVSRTVFLATLCLAGAAHAASTPPESPVPAPASAPSAGAAASAPAPVSAPVGRSRGGAAAKSKSKSERKNQVVELVHVNRHESMQLRIRDASGKPVRGQQKRFNRFLRCHYTNVQHAMNPRLISLIYRTGRHWSGHRIEVVSGYRHPKVSKNPRSPHMKGLACDFRVVGVSNQDLRDYLRRNFEKVGVGYYPNSSFVHLDIRKDHSAFWIDYSGPGERAIYSAAPGDDLKSGRADRFHPSKIDSSWAEAAAPQGQMGAGEGAGEGEELTREAVTLPAPVVAAPAPTDQP
jgi:uncharacterized protein YcbK (DUF882 family)